MCRKLKSTFPVKSDKSKSAEPTSFYQRIEAKKENTGKHKKRKSGTKIPEINLDE